MRSDGAILGAESKILAKLVMSGYLAVILFVISTGAVHMLEPIHFEKKVLCERYLKDRLAKRAGAIVRKGRCVPMAHIRYNGDVLFEAIGLLGDD